MRATTDGTLADVPVRFGGGHACCVIMASEGYPAHYERGFPIEIPAAVLPHVYVAGAALRDGTLVTSGGRVLGVTATAPTLGGAIDLAYERVGEIRFENAFWRRDIGARAMRAEERK
jgi:phosphoribosylamine--glycine ligase